MSAWRMNPVAALFVPYLCLRRSANGKLARAATLELCLFAKHETRFRKRRTWSRSTASPVEFNKRTRYGPLPESCRGESCSGTTQLVLLSCHPSILCLPVIHHSGNSGTRRVQAKQINMQHYISLATEDSPPSLSGPSQVFQTLVSSDGPFQTSSTTN